MKKYFVLAVLLSLAGTALSQISHSFSFQTTDFSISTDNEYTLVSNNNFNASTVQEGAPGLPVLLKSFVLPAGSKLTKLTISNSDQVLLTGNALLYPAQPPEEGDGLPEFVPPDSLIYQNPAAFPVKTAVIKEDYYMLGHHIVTVAVCPFKYKPLQKKLYLYQNIGISIKYTAGTIEQTETISHFRENLSKEMVKSMVANPELVGFTGATAKIVTEETGETDKLLMHWLPMGNAPDYLIITNQELSPVFQQLADYKTKRGMPSLVVTVEDIYIRYPGVDRAEKIRNYLKDACRNWGASLFVLLGGDTDIIPGRLADYYGNAEVSPSDLYYSDVYNPDDPNYNWNKNGNSRFGENTGDGLEFGFVNFLGRAPVKNTTEANTFLEKVMKYEKLEGVSDKSYVNNMLFLGAYHSYPPIVEVDPTGSYIENGQKWHAKLKNEPFLNSVNLKKWLIFDDYETIPIYQPFFGNEELNDVNVLSRMNNGEPDIGMFHLVSYYDHGSPYGVGSSNRMKELSVYREDMDNLSNGNYLQIMYTTGCAPGKFTVDAWAEHYMNNPNGGGVGIIANSATVGTQAYLQDVGFFQSIYGEENYKLSDDAYLLGVAFSNARSAYDYSRAKKVLTLFGDPTLATWSATPTEIPLSVFPPAINISNTTDNELSVNFGSALNEDALITLYKYNEDTAYPDVYATQTITAGQTTANFIIHPDTPGELLVTATAKNHLPATATVAIEIPEPHLYVTHANFLDENENDILEPGESVVLSLDITNSGQLPINGFQVVLSTHNGMGVFTENIQGDNGILDAGDSFTLTGFTFTVGTSYNGGPLPDYIEFFADITSGSYQHKDNFYIEQKGPELNLRTRTVTDENGQQYSGNLPGGTALFLDIAIQNTGNVATGILNAELTSTVPGLVFTSYESSYPDIAVNSEESNTAPFEFVLSPDYSGALSFKLTLTNEFGREWEFEFDLSETCPAKITGFNFVPEPDRINLMWNPVQGISGYNIYRSANESGTYVKVNDYSVAGTSAYTDYQLTIDTNYYYKISVISLSGQECPLDELTAYRAWTSRKAKDGFPVHNSNIRQAYSSPVIYDVDNDGKKEIFLNYRRGNHDKGIIMGIRHNGQELFDIDNDPETVSGFALTNLAMPSNSAVGDLDNDGHAEVISTGRNNSLNQGRLYAYKTIDTDNDGKPDIYFNSEYIDLGQRALRNPVLYDLDNDGYLEIIVADESQKIYVFDHYGNQLWSVQAGNGDWSEGEIAVADFNGDGFGEIALGVKKTDNGTTGGIYIFKHDGTPYTTNPFHEFDSGERADGGITFADLDNNGVFELLAITKKGGTGKIYAFNFDGTYFDPDNNGTKWDGAISFLLNSTNDTQHLLPRISVGDINNDGSLEIVFGSKNHLYALDIYGEALDGFPVENVGDITDTTPILADIDGDSNIEIIVNLTQGANNYIKAFKSNGSICDGWPAYSEGFNPFVGSPAVGDIDNDGLNDVIISATDGTTYVWNTAGSADRIEWGMHRSDSYNTGAYKNGCTGEVDLYIKDGPFDLGTEPNLFTEQMWTSQDIWVRNENDGGLEHQNPAYKADQTPNYIMIRVINRGCKASSGAETLTVNWAKATTNLPYPSNWDGSMTVDGIKMGGVVIGTPLTLPVIQPGEEAVIVVPWVVPNPADYTSSPDGNPQHFCLLATILGATDPLTHNYTENPNIMVRENNNQAWRNLTVVGLYPGKPIGGSVAVFNHSTATASFDLLFNADSAETGKLIIDEAEVTVVLDSVLYAAWEAGGKKMSEGIQLRTDKTGTQNIFYITQDSVKLMDLKIEGKTRGLLSVRFNVLTKELTSKRNYLFHLTQLNNKTNEIMGGESYEIRKPSRNPFYAISNSVTANRYAPVTLAAQDINEAAVYNWYDEDGELVYTGAELNVIADIAKTYKLEIIADTDGYKDYTDVNVELNPNELQSLVPNPAGSSVMVTYTLNAPDSAYLSVTGYVGNDTGVVRNYMLNTESSQHLIDLSNYATGFYVVKLICDGHLIGTLNLIKE